MPDTDFLPDYLTDEQRDIITAGYEHAVITAVAGSGKTSTLAWRIRYLLAQGHDPDRMLVLMFNRSARVDFERKLQSVCHQSGLSAPTTPWACAFTNASCAKATCRVSPRKSSPNRKSATKPGC